MESQTHIHWHKKQNWPGGGGRQPYSLESRKYNYVQPNYSSLMHMPLGVAGFTSTFQSWPLKRIRYKPFKKHRFLSLYLWAPFSATSQLLYSPTTGGCLLQPCRSKKCPTRRVQRRLPSSPVARKVLLWLFQTQVWSLGTPIKPAG